MMWGDIRHVLSPRRHVTNADCRDYSDRIFKDVKWLDKCLGIQDEQNNTRFSGVGNCIGKGAVLRISFGTFLFFAVHFVLLIGELQCH